MNQVHTPCLVHYWVAFMSTKQRRQREFAEREQCFLAKACELIDQHGLLKLQMQRVAEACEYSVGTLYHHFKSKEDMLLALMTRRVGDRLALFERVARWQACSRDRMVGLILADLLFAYREPLFFQLHQYLSTPVIAAAITPECREQAMAAHLPLADIFTAVMDEAVAAGDVDPGLITTRQLGFGLWALGEGIHTLVHAEGLPEAYRVNSPYSLLLHHSHAMLNGHQWQPLYSLKEPAQQQAFLNRLFDEVFHDFSATAFATLVATGEQE